MTIFFCLTVTGGRASPIEFIDGILASQKVSTYEFQQFSTNTTPHLEQGGQHMKMTMKLKSGYYRSDNSACAFSVSSVR
jgi:glucuronate isomerase